MKKIIISASIIVAVAAVVIGATTAYFSDTETSVGNIISAGVIDISVDNENPWSKTYSDGLQDLKPGDLKEITFTVENEGQNPVVLRKMIGGLVPDGGISTEPECQEAVGVWDNSSKTCTSGNQDNDLSKAIIYDMTVTPQGGSSIVVIPESWNIRLNKVANLWVSLGTIPAGQTLVVKQSYRLASDTTNWAQGDTLTFNIVLYAEQRMGDGSPTVNGVVLDNKTGDPDWYSVVDGTLAVLNRTGRQSYTVDAFGLEASQTYRLAYSVSPYSNFTLLATGVAGGTGNLALSGSNLPVSLSNGKIWLLYGDGSINGGWGDNLKNLWETNLVNY